VAKNRLKNSFQKASKAVDFQRENQPGRNPEFSVSPLWGSVTIFAEIYGKPFSHLESNLPGLILQDSQLLAEMRGL